LERDGIDPSSPLHPKKPLLKRKKKVLIPLPLFS